MKIGARVVAVALAVVALLASGGCPKGGPATGGGDSFDAKVAEAKQRLPEGGSIPLRELTAFDWDQVFVFAPYTPMDRARTLMSLTAVPPQLAKTGIDARDDINAFVFLKQAAVVQVLSVARARVEFSLAGAGPFAREAATLRKLATNGPLVFTAAAPP